MGCWNGTCLLGGLPLTHGTKIRAFLILMNKEQAAPSGFCYGGGIAKPISFGLLGEYNDYGSIECLDEDTVESQMLFDYLKGKEKSGKLEVQETRSEKFTSIEDIGLGDFITSFVERDLVTIDGQGLGIAFMSEQLFQGTVKGLEGSWDYRLGDTDIKKDIRYYLEDRFESDWPTPEQMLDKNSPWGIRRKLLQTPWELDDGRKTGNWHNVVSRFSYPEGLSHSFTSHTHRFLEENYDPKRKEEYVEILHELFLVIDVMDGLRRAWTPLTGKGGQDQGWHIFDAYSKAIAKQVDNAFCLVCNNGKYEGECECTQC